MSSLPLLEGFELFTLRKEDQFFSEVEVYVLKHVEILESVKFGGRVCMQKSLALRGRAGKRFYLKPWKTAYQ